MSDFVTIVLPRGSHWMRYRVISEFIGFPNDIAGIIVDYLQILKLRDWIDEKKIRAEENLAANPDAFAANMLPDIDIIDTHYLVDNPYAIDYIKQHPDLFIVHGHKWSNPKIVEWLIPLGIYPEVSEYLGNSRCMLAVDRTISMNQGNIDNAVRDLSGNPMAIDLIRKHLHVINPEDIWSNPAAVDILIDMIAAGKEINWEYLSLNDSEWAMAMLRENIDKIDYCMFSQNPMIFEPKENPNKKELLSILTGDCTKYDRA